MVSLFLLLLSVSFDDCFYLLLGVHIRLQEKLLNKANQPCRPDQEFLGSFAAVVGADWSSLAVSLSLGRSVIEEVKRVGEEGLSPRDHAHRMLKMWAAREDATYGQLCTALKAIPLFQYSKEQSDSE